MGSTGVSMSNFYYCCGCEPENEKDVPSPRNAMIVGEVISTGSPKELVREYTKCPQCAKVYPLTYDDPRMRTPIEREQHLTGICSDKCWDKFLGVTD